MIKIKIDAPVTWHLPHPISVDLNGNLTTGMCVHCAACGDGIGIAWLIVQETPPELLNHENIELQIRNMVGHHHCEVKAHAHLN